MEAYTGFASVYDQLMDNIPYEEWAGYLHGLMEEYQVNEGLVLDLGCGTGTMTELLAGYGYDMIGVDCSEEMLGAAMEKRSISGHDILYLLQDMREFELYGTVRAVVSVCDSINYMTEIEDLEQVFCLVNNYLDPGGIFIFDFNTEYKYREVIGNCTIAESREDCGFIWENDYDAEEMVNEYDLTLFIREDSGKRQEIGNTGQMEGEGLFRRFQETHFQKAYTLEQIRSSLADAGLEYVQAYDAFTRKQPHEKSERICVVAREHGKKTDRLSV